MTESTDTITWEILYWNDEYCPSWIMRGYVIDKLKKDAQVPIEGMSSYNYWSDVLGSGSPLAFYGEP